MALNKSTMNFDGMHKKDGQVAPGEVATLQSYPGQVSVWMGENFLTHFETSTVSESTSSH